MEINEKKYRKDRLRFEEMKVKALTNMEKALVRFVNNMEDFLHGKSKRREF